MTLKTNICKIMVLKKHDEIEIIESWLSILGNLGVEEVKLTKMRWPFTAKIIRVLTKSSLGS